MSQPHLPDHVQTVRAFLRKTHVLFQTSGERQFHFIARRGGYKSNVDVARYTSDPDGCAERAIARLRSDLHLSAVPA